MFETGRPKRGVEELGAGGKKRGRASGGLQPEKKAKSEVYHLHPSKKHRQGKESRKKRGGKHYIGVMGPVRRGNKEQREVVPACGFAER